MSQQPMTRVMRHAYEYFSHHIRTSGEPPPATFAATELGVSVKSIYYYARVLREMGYVAIPAHYGSMVLVQGPGGPVIPPASPPPPRTVTVPLCGACRLVVSRRGHGWYCTTEGCRSFGLQVRPLMGEV